MGKSVFQISKVIVIRIILFFLVAFFLSPFMNVIYAQNGNWSAPKSADQIKNLYKGNENATLIGKQLYTKFCAICHGKKGKGDGVAGMALKPRPSNFTKEIVQKQSDGAIYWKVTEGKPPMAAYKETLTDEQRWQLVNYIRSLQ